MFLSVIIYSLSIYNKRFQKGKKKLKTPVQLRLQQQRRPEDEPQFTNQLKKLPSTFAT